MLAKSFMREHFYYNSVLMMVIDLSMKHLMRQTSARGKSAATAQRVETTEQCFS